MLRCDDFIEPAFLLAMTYKIDLNFFFLCWFIRRKWVLEDASAIAELLRIVAGFEELNNMFYETIKTEHTVHLYLLSLDNLFSTFKFKTNI